MGKPVEGVVEALVEELIKDTELELVAVEYVREKEWYLRIFIDKAGGIDLDDCQELSGKIGDLLDEKDIIPDKYILEVSSPGLDRELKTAKDFKREMGKAVDVKFFAPFEGKKELTGTLKAWDGDNILIDELTIPYGKVAKVNLHIDF